MATITIGRDNSCDITINDPSVSRNHASISKRDGNTYILHDTSSNGTMVNGILVKGREVAVSYGDSILLSGAVPLPWNKVQLLLPLDDINSFIPFQTVEKEESVTYKDGTVGVIIGYVIALLGGYFGLIIGLTLALSRNRVNGKKYPTYKESTVQHGWIIFVISIISMIIWNIVIIH